MGTVREGQRLEARVAKIVFIDCFSFPVKIRVRAISFALGFLRQAIIMKKGCTGDLKSKLTTSPD